MNDFQEALRLLSSAFFYMAVPCDIKGEKWYDSMANGIIEEVGDFLCKHGILEKMERGYEINGHFFYNRPLYYRPRKDKE